MKKELGMDAELPFGKYKGTEVEEVLSDDPSYLQWMAENTGIEFDDEVSDKIAKI